MRVLLLSLTVLCALPAAAWVAPAGPEPIDMGTLHIVAQPLKRGITLDPRAPRAEPPAEMTARPRDLVRKSFRRALLRTASSL